MEEEKGLTTTMLTITIVVMLIITTTLIYFSLNRDSIIGNATDIKFKEDVSAMKSKIEQKIITKQEIKGNENVELTEEEKEEILGEYYPDKLVVINQKLFYKKNGGFSNKEKSTLSELDIEETE